MKRLNKVAKGYHLVTLSLCNKWAAFFIKALL